MKQSFLTYLTRPNPETGKPQPHEGKRKVFLSYRHADEQHLPLCRLLAEQILSVFDVAVWYDSQLTAGECYDEEIQAVLSEADAAIVLLTPTILSSAYILETEIPSALQNQISVIPVLAGISETDIPRIEQVVGRIHMPTWFLGKRDEAPPFPRQGLEQLWNGIALSIASKDLLSQASLFCERGGDTLSLRYLTPEQVFIKAYGCLFGVRRLGDKPTGVKLMESILHSYGADTDFETLQREVGIALLCHFYTTNKPELFCTYAKRMLEKGLEKKLLTNGIFYHMQGDTADRERSLYDLLFHVYRNGWHPEVLCTEHDLSLALFRACFLQNYGRAWSPEDVETMQANKVLCTPQSPTAKAGRKVGMLTFDGHTAYLAERDNETAELILDGQCLATVDVFAAVGDVSMAYLAYDADAKLLLLLHSEFDHYDVETVTDCRAFSLADDRIYEMRGARGCVRGLSHFPFSPHTLHGI